MQSPVTRVAGDTFIATVAGDRLEWWAARARGTAHRPGRSSGRRRTTGPGVRSASAGNRLMASAPIRFPVASDTMGCGAAVGPPAANTGSRRVSIGGKASSP